MLSAYGNKHILNQPSALTLVGLLLLSYLCQLKSQFTASNYAKEIENYKSGQCLTIQDIPNFSLPQNIAVVFHRIQWKAIVNEL